MNLQSLNQAFAANYTRVDEDLPREERIRYRVHRYFNYVSFATNSMSPQEREDAEDLVFLMKKLYVKLPDANEEVLSRLAQPLLPILQDWLKNLQIPRINVDVRTLIDPRNFISAALCNHGGPDGCDCGEHPTK